MNGVIGAHHPNVREHAAAVFQHRREHAEMSSKHFYDRCLCIFFSARLIFRSDYAKNYRKNFNAQLIAHWNSFATLKC